MWRHLVLAALLVAAQSAPAQTVDCLVSPRRVAQLAFGTPGLVSRIAVERGDAVQRGQVLAELDASIEKASLAIAQAQFQATAAVAAARADVALAAKALERTRLLVERKALSQERFDAATNVFDQARLELAELEELRGLRALDVARAQAVVALRTITSPFTGVVVERHVAPGEFVDTKPVVTVAEIDPLFVDLLVPAEAFDTVRPGQNIRVTLQQTPGRIVTAQARVIDPYVDASSGTFRVRATLQNPDQAIIPGFGCAADLPEVAAN